jgi:membrane associated rhomboid family serine protease
MKRRYPGGSSFGSSFKDGLAAFFGQPLTPAVKWLMIGLGAAYVIQIAAKIPLAALAATPLLIFTYGYVWQLVTATVAFTDVFSFLFSLLALYSLGVPMERRLGGPRRFLTWYFIWGTLTHVMAATLAVLIGKAAHPGIVSSGSSAPLGLLIGAYGMLTWNVVSNFNFFPVRGKVIVWFFGGLSLFVMLQGRLDATGSLCGLIAGALSVQWSRSQLARRVRADVEERLRVWRIRRKYKNFRVVESDMQRMWDDLEERMNDKERNRHIH